MALSEPLITEQFYHIYNRANGDEKMFKPEDWEFSTYRHIISTQSNNRLHHEILGWFDDLDNFRFCHNRFQGIDDIWI